MAIQDQDFLRRLRATFDAEARDHLAAMYASLAELEHAADEARRAQLVETVFREAHSLKGAAGAVSLAPVERVCQALENTFAAMKRKELELTGELFDQLHRELDQIRTLLSASAAPPSDKDQGAFATMPPPSANAMPGAAAEEKKLGTVRISTAKLDSIFVQAEEMLAAKLLAQHHEQELQKMQALISMQERAWANWPSRYPGLRETVSARPEWLHLLQHNVAFLKDLRYQLNFMAKAAGQEQRLVCRMVDDLLGELKQVLMLPFSTLTAMFPKLVRDLAAESGKKIEMGLRGGDIEVDRRILEEIKDPLIHLVRNAIDHGIEKPQDRKRRFKSETGRIEIAIATRSGGQVEITIADDGAGIDGAKLKESAQRLGMLSRERADALDEQAAVELMYESGVSTSPIVTDISGRGLGLAIVREKVERLGGTLALHTEAGNGTRFSLCLPNTLATYRGIVVRLDDQQYVLPTHAVEQTLRIPKTSVQTVENHETIQVRDEVVAVVRLADVLEMPIPAAAEDSAFMHVAVLAVGGKRVALIVDEVLNEQEVLVKSLGPQLARVRNIEAATVLWSGKAALILNVTDLMQSALHVQDGRARLSKTLQRQEKSVLVVEDSITARSLLKSVLEMAGYRVATAVDGIDALAQLRSSRFDIVVSDVEMPRMNGLDLTARIRADKKLGELPVVLVTALESSDDRERGIDVGANAYIVKRDFEQSNLLEVMQHLV